MTNRIEGFVKNACGQSAVETAVAFLIITPLMVWLLEMCMFAYTQAVFQYATRQAVQYAMSHGTDAMGCQGPGSGANSQGCDATAAATKSLITRLTISTTTQSLTASQITTTWSNGTNNPGDPVSVTISGYKYHSLFNVPWLSSSGSKVMLINTTSGGNVLY
jgi:Flp pilus assembly protein TadG